MRKITGYVVKKPREAHSASTKCNVVLIPTTDWITEKQIILTLNVYKDIL